MLELDCEEGWAPKNWCFWTVVLEKTLESPLDCNEIQPVLLKGNRSWVFIGKTDAEAETLVLWPPDAKSWLIGKDPDVRRDWGHEKGTTEDEMVWWHHCLDGHEFELNSRSWWWTGRPGMLWVMGSQWVGHDWATELSWYPLYTYTLQKSLPCHGKGACATQWSYEPCHAGPLKMGQVKRSDEMWSSGEGNGNLPQYCCLENPKDSLKRQKYMMLVCMCPSGHKVSNILLGKSKG